MSAIAQLQTCLRISREAYLKLSDAIDEAPAEHADRLRKLTDGTDSVCESLRLEIQCRRELAESHAAQDDAGDAMEVAERPARFETV